MSDNKQPGSGKVIRTSSGSTRLTAGSSKTDDKTGNGQPPASGTGSGNGRSNGSSGYSAEKPTVVAPPAPKASPKPNRAPSGGSATGSAGGPASGGAAAGGSAPSGQATGSQRTSNGSGPATSAMGAAANTVRASSGSVKMGVKNIVDSGKGKKKKGPRTVRLTVSAVDPWSVMKMSFLMSVAIGIATIVAFIVLWVVLQATGVMSGLETTMTELAGAESAEKLIGIFGFGRVVAAGFIIAVINIVLMTALSTLAAFIYNIGSLIAGGFHLTLTDD